MKRLTIAALGLLCANMAWAACNKHITPSTPSWDFIVHDNGTVSHTATGLMWKTCQEGYEYTNNTCNEITNGTQIFSWAAALNHVHTLNSNGGFAGHQDWRLPNIKELYSIVERRCYEPAINETVFPTDMRLQVVWSASPLSGTPARAWGMNFDSSSGGYGTHMEKQEQRAIRLVRSLY